MKKGNKSEPNMDYLLQGYKASRDLCGLALLSEQKLNVIFLKIEHQLVTEKLEYRFFQSKIMSLLPVVKLYLREDESILPAKQTPPWPKAFFIHFSVGRFVNVYHSEGLIQNPVGETANFCLCFEPVEVGSLYNTFYHPMEEFISRDGAAKFFRGMLAFFHVRESVDQSIFDNFFSITRSLAADARAYDRKIVPLVVEIIIDLWEEFHPGIFEISIPNYVAEIMGKGSENGVCCSSLQVLKRPKLDSGSEEQCPICFEILDGEQQALQLPCSHLYHSHCILKWFGNNSSCPLCRYLME